MVGTPLGLCGIILCGVLDMDLLKGISEFLFEQRSVLSLLMTVIVLQGFCCFCCMLSVCCFCIEMTMSCV